jgi:hypothetical protein
MAGMQKTCLLLEFEVRSVYKTYQEETKEKWGGETTSRFGEP